MAKRKKKKTKKEPPPNTRHINCAICQHLPEKSWEGDSYGKDWGGIAEQATQLIIIGKSVYTSDRFRILKQCPICGNFYEFEHDYEFLGTGFENEYNLTRLSDTEGVAWAKQIFTDIYDQVAPEEASDWRKKETEIFNFDFVL